MKSDGGLTKLTRGNQVTIPKSIVRRIGLRQGRDYLRVEYTRGSIIMNPVEINERVPDEAYAKLAGQATRLETGDVKANRRTAHSVLQDRRKR